MKRELRRRFESDLELVKAVLRRWDPIGVGPDSPGSECRDEYDAYAPQLLSLLYSRATAGQIADRLEQLRTATMGMPANRATDERTAEELLQLTLTPPLSVGRRRGHTP